MGVWGGGLLTSPTLGLAGRGPHGGVGLESAGSQVEGGGLDPGLRGFSPGAVHVTLAWGKLGCISVCDFLVCVVRDLDCMVGFQESVRNHAQPWGGSLAPL